MTGTFEPIGAAALSVEAMAAHARAEYLRQLERAIMFDTDPEYRAQAKAEYLELTAPRCERCGGIGKVFLCRQWSRCGCIDGTIESSCPGHSAPCPACGSSEVSADG